MFWQAYRSAVISSSRYIRNVDLSWRSKNALTSLKKIQGLDVESEIPLTGASRDDLSTLLPPCQKPLRHLASIGLRLWRCLITEEGSRVRSLLVLRGPVTRRRPTCVILINGRNHRKDVLWDASASYPAHQCAVRIRAAKCLLVNALKNARRRS